MRLLQESPSVDQQQIDFFRKTEYIRRSIAHVKCYAKEFRARSTSPERLRLIESKVKQNLRSQVKAKARVNRKREIWGQDDDEIVRELSSGKKFSEIATAQKYCQQEKSNRNSK